MGKTTRGLCLAEDRLAPRVFSCLMALVAAAAAAAAGRGRPGRGRPGRRPEPREDLAVGAVAVDDEAAHGVGERAEHRPFGAVRGPRHGFREVLFDEHDRADVAVILVIGAGAAV